MNNPIQTASIPETLTQQQSSQQSIKDESGPRVQWTEQMDLLLAQAAYAKKAYIKTEEKMETKWNDISALLFSLPEFSKYSQLKHQATHNRFNKITRDVIKKINNRANFNELENLLIMMAEEAAQKDGRWTDGASNESGEIILTAKETNNDSRKSVKNLLSQPSVVLEIEVRERKVNLEQSRIKFDEDMKDKEEEREVKRRRIALDEEQARLKIEYEKSLLTLLQGFVSVVTDLKNKMEVIESKIKK